MKKHAAKRIKNSTLILWFSCFVFLAIIISLIVKVVILISQSTFDNHHQFILEVKEGDNKEAIIAFNPGLNTIAMLQVSGAKKKSDITSLQIPIDAQVTLPDNTHPSNISSILSPLLFHCTDQNCQHLNSVDAFKLYLFNKHIRIDTIKTNKISLPVSQITLTTVLPLLFTDSIIYREALSVAIVNASGQPGLGTTFSKFLTTLGYNVISVSSGDIQTPTTIQTSVQGTSYSLQRLLQILHVRTQKMQKPGISDIIITIGKKHPQF